MIRLKFAAPLALALVVAAVPAGAQGPSPASWQSQVKALLDRRSRAVMAGDATAFVATMRGAPAAFVKDRRTSFERLRALPLGSYALSVDESAEFGDLARAKDRKRWGNDVHVVQVKERISLRGFDRAPAGEDLFLTVRRDSSGWSIVSDSDVEDLALYSMRNLWDFGAVAATARDGIMVVTHPAQRSVAESILSAAQRARATARSRWPDPWADPIVIMIPSTVAELARILQTQFDLSTFVAFASSSLDRRTGWSLGGDRVFLHWPNFSRYGDGFRHLILAHEFTHLATRETTAQWIPAFMDEGIAQYYGEAAGGAPVPQLRRRVRDGRFDGKLPEDWFFTAGPDDDIFAAYEMSTSFIAYLGGRFGRNAGARAYLAVGKTDPVSPGTWRYHLDRVFRLQLKSPLAVLESGWADKTRKDLG